MLLLVYLLFASIPDLAIFPAVAGIPAVAGFLFWRWHPAIVGISAVARTFCCCRRPCSCWGVSGIAGKASMLLLASYFSGVHAVAGALAIGSVPAIAGIPAAGVLATCLLLASLSLLAFLLFCHILHAVAGYFAGFRSCIDTVLY